MPEKGLTDTEQKILWRIGMSWSMVKRAEQMVQGSFKGTSRSRAMPCRACSYKGMT